MLHVDATLPQVHWAIASWTDPADDPAALPGLAQAVLAAAMRGTWNTGSRDAAQEQQALAALDALWQQAPATPDAAFRERLAAATAAADACVDPNVLPRQLAALPVHRCELERHGSSSVLVLTTLASALPEVAAMLLDRRERTVLRGLPECWQQRVVTAPDTLDAELLALALPDHPWTRAALPRPMPSRAEAFAAWQASQRPDRTVHVLVGDFEPKIVAELLQRTFAGTSPATTPAPRAAVRPFAGVRRSQVAGAARASVRLAWPLPERTDRHVLAVLMHWLTDARDGALGQQMLRSGRARATVACRAPWPPAIGGSGLFVLEVRDDDGIDGAAERVRAALKVLAAKEPEAAALNASIAALQQDWRRATADPRQLAVELATAALGWPAAEVADAAPRAVEPRAVHALLRRLAELNPAIVEGRP